MAHNTANDGFFLTDGDLETRPTPMSLSVGFRGAEALLKLAALIEFADACVQEEEPLTLAGDVVLLMLTGSEV